MSELITLENASQIVSNVGNKLIENKNLMRCIKYDNSSALSSSLPDVTPEERIDLVGQGIDPKNQQRIYKRGFTNRILDAIRTELRFFIPKM